VKRRCHIASSAVSDQKEKQRSLSFGGSLFANFLNVTSTDLLMVPGNKLFYFADEDIICLNHLPNAGILS